MGHEAWPRHISHCWTLSVSRSARPSIVTALAHDCAVLASESVAVFAGLLAVSPECPAAMPPLRTQPSISDLRASRHATRLSVLRPHIVARSSAVLASALRAVDSATRADAIDTAWGDLRFQGEPTPQTTLVE